MGEHYNLFIHFSVFKSKIFSLILALQRKIYNKLQSAHWNSYILYLSCIYHILLHAYLYITFQISPTLELHPHFVPTFIFDFVLSSFPFTTRIFLFKLYTFSPFVFQLCVLSQHLASPRSSAPSLCHRCFSLYKLCVFWSVYGESGVIINLAGSPTFRHNSRAASVCVRVCARVCVAVRMKVRSGCKWISYAQVKMWENMF